MSSSKSESKVSSSSSTQAMRVALAELTSGSLAGDVYVQPSQGAAFFLKDRQSVKQQILDGLNNKSNSNSTIGK